MEALNSAPVKKKKSVSNMTAFPATEWIAL